MAALFGNSRSLRFLAGKLPSDCLRIVRTKRTVSMDLLPAAGVAQPEMSKIKPYSEIPGPKGLYNLPYIGLLFHLKPFTNYTLENIHHLFEKLMNRYGPIFRLQLDKPTVIITEGNDIATVYNFEGRYPERPNVNLIDVFFQRSGKKPSLAFAQGEDWLTMRIPFSKRLLKSNSVRPSLPKLNKVSDEFVSLIAAGGLENDNDKDGPFLLYSLESVATVVFNRRLGYLTNKMDSEAKEFLDATVMAIEFIKLSLIGEALAYRLYKDKVYQDFEKTQRTIERSTKKFVQMGKKDLEREKREGTFNPKESNFLYSLLNDPSLSDEIIERGLETVYSGGVDSTASTLRTCFFLLAKHPDKQEKLRQEVHSIIGRDQPVTSEALDNMSYLRAFLKECYRTAYPITGGGTFRRLPKDAVIGGYHIPAGTQVMSYHGNIVRAGFKNPDKFLPERWLREKGFKQIPGAQSVWAVRPFGHGPRMCIGRRVAENELALGIAKTLQKLRIGIKPESRDIQFNYSIFIKPERKIDFVITKI